MLTSTFLHRSAALIASSGAAVALALVPAGGAHAAVHAQYLAEAQADASYTGTVSGGDCTLTSGDDNPESTPVAFTHGTKHKSVHLNATFTNNQNPSDTVQITGHLDSKLTLKRKQGNLASFSMAADGATTFAHSITGSECEASSQLFAVAEPISFTEHKKGWLTITRDTKKPNAITEYALVNVNTGKAISFDIFEGPQSHEVVRAKLKPGSYSFQFLAAGLQGGGQVFLKSASRTSKTKLTTTVQGQFKPIKH